MGTPYPVSVRIGGAPQAFVIDAGFALSPMGLLVTMALASRAAVWLPRGLLNLLDNDRAYRQSPDLMGGEWLPPATRPARLAIMAAELPAWQRAWHYGKLSARVHWIGDAQYESALADRENAALLPRFERCAAALEARLSEDGETATAPLDDCARDAVALAAALQPDPVWLVTLAGYADAEPPLCSLLVRAGFGVRQSHSALASSGHPALEAALVPLEASGDPAALLQIVAPGALTLADDWDTSDWVGDADCDVEAGQNVWRNACALWQPLAVRALAA